MATLYDYRSLLERFSHYSATIHTYKEAEERVAAVEKAIIDRGVSLHPYTSCLSINVDAPEEENEGDDEGEIENDLKQQQQQQTEEGTKQEKGEETVAVPMSEAASLFEKKFTEVMKVSTAPTAITGKRVNLDNMILPMALQKKTMEGQFLLVPKGKTVGLAEVTMDLTEEEKKRLASHAKYQDRQNRRIKQRTLRLNEAHEMDGDVHTDAVESIFNRRIAPPQGRESWKRRS